MSIFVVTFYYSKSSEMYLFHSVFLTLRRSKSFIGTRTDFNKLRQITENLFAFPYCLKWYYKNETLN